MTVADIVSILFVFLSLCYLGYRILIWVHTDIVLRDDMG